MTSQPPAQPAQPGSFPNGGAGAFAIVGAEGGPSGGFGGGGGGGYDTGGGGAPGGGTEYGGCIVPAFLFGDTGFPCRARSAKKSRNSRSARAIEATPSAMLNGPPLFDSPTLRQIKVT